MHLFGDSDQFNNAGNPSAFINYFKVNRGARCFYLTGHRALMAATLLAR